MFLAHAENMMNAVQQQLNFLTRKCSEFYKSGDARADELVIDMQMVL